MIYGKTGLPNIEKSSSKMRTGVGAVMNIAVGAATDAALAHELNVLRWGGSKRHGWPLRRWDGNERSDEEGLLAAVNPPRSPEVPEGYRSTDPLVHEDDPFVLAHRCHLLGQLSESEQRVEDAPS
jgi:hypothetical protein